VKDTGPHAPAEQCPSIAAEWQDPKGVPISAILFGGRRRTTVPLVTQAFNWEHGVFLGSIMASETTAAQAGAVGNLRFDPMAMLPFCGYNMADYFGHWLKVGSAAKPENLPQIFFVNWFRRDTDGRFLWPGYGENSRVLKWVFERLDGTAGAVETPIGNLPVVSDLDTSGLKVDAADMSTLLSVDTAGWLEAVPQIREHYATFGAKLPQQLTAALDSLEKALA
jgi:phosphoenolpyruvate carboxykinase (GTP)